jgi:hypothetical protein
MPNVVISGINPGFPELSQSQGQVAHVLLTRSPLEYPRRGLSARLACVKHAASVRPEPGSNSPLNDSHPGPPKGKPGKTSHPATEQTMTIPCETHPERHTPRRGFSTKNALAFNTLLSSQETRTRQARQTTRHRGNPLTLLRVLPGVNLVPENFADSWDFPCLQDTNVPGSRGTHVAPDNGFLVAPRVPSRLPAFRPQGNKNTRGKQHPRQIKARRGFVPR